MQETDISRARAKHISGAEKRRRRVAKGLPALTERQKASTLARSRSTKSRGARRARMLRWRYGLTVAQYTSLMDTQKNRCAICRAPFNPRMKQLAPQVDHCHETNRVRGILCTTCNTALARFNDNPAWLRAAIRYLDDSRNK
jgi:Recombination endonuclease VII